MWLDRQLSLYTTPSTYRNLQSQLVCKETKRTVFNGVHEPWSCFHVNDEDDLPDNAHAWSKIYQEFQYGFVYIANETRDIEIISYFLT